MSPIIVSVFRCFELFSSTSQVLITDHQNSGALQTLAPLSSGGPVGENLSREIYRGLKTNARWLPEPTQLEVICHPVQDVIVSKPNANIWQRQTCEFGNRGVGVRPDLRLALPIGHKDSFG